MKNGWATKTIEELCVLRPPKAEARNRLKPHAKVSFIPMDELGIDTKYPSPPASRPLDEVYGSYTYFADGDVLLAKITPCFQNGKLGIARNLVNGIGFGSSEFFVLRPNANLDREYLYYFLAREDFRQEGVLRMGGAVGQQRVPPEFVLSQRLMLPPLAEQRRIVGILDEAFAGIATAKAHAEQNLQNARALFDSHLNAVFTQCGDHWVETTIGDILALEYGKPLPESKRKPTGAYPVYGANGEKGRSNDYYVDRPTIIVGRKGSAGEINLTREKFWPLDVTYFVEYDDEEYDLRFLYYLLQTQHLTRLAKGVKPGINRNDVYALRVKTPVLREQKRIAAELDELSGQTGQLDSVNRRKLAALDELKKSILQKAFKGEF